MNLRQKTVRGVLWSTLRSWSSSLVSALVFIILTRLLAPEDIGLVAIAWVFIALVTLFVDSGIAPALVQRAEVQPQHFDTAFWLGSLFGLLLFAVGAATAPLIASIYNEPELTNVLRALAATFIFVGLSSTPAAVLRREFSFKRLAIRGILASIVGGTVGVGMALAGYGVWSLVGWRLAESFSNLALVWVATTWRPGLRPSFARARELLGFSGNVLGARVLHIISRRMDDLLIGYFLGTTVLGFYVVGYRLVRLTVEVLGKSLSAVLMPAFARVQHDRQRVLVAYYTGTRMIGLIVIPAFVGLAILAPEIILTVFGEKWQASIDVLRVLSFAGLVQGIFILNGPVMMALGKPSWVLWLAALDAVTNVAAFAVAVHWGIVAVALAFTLRFYLFAPIRFYCLNKLIGVGLGDYVRQLAPPLVGAAAMAGVLLGLMPWAAGALSPPQRLLVFLPLGVMVYALVIVAISPASLKQLLQIGSLALPARAKKP